MMLIFFFLIKMTNIIVENDGGINSLFISKDCYKTNSFGIKTLKPGNDTIYLDNETGLITTDNTKESLLVIT